MSKDPVQIVTTVVEADTLYYPMPIPEGTVCRNCGKPNATQWWTGDGGMFAAIHGQAVPWCELCGLRVQLEHARERAAAIPGIEAQIAKLEAERGGA